MHVLEKLKHQIIDKFQSILPKIIWLYCICDVFENINQYNKAKNVLIESEGDIELALESLKKDNSLNKDKNEKLRKINVEKDSLLLNSAN